jgi:hypothetical protein
MNSPFLLAKQYLFPKIIILGTIADELRQMQLQTGFNVVPILRDFFLFIFNSIQFSSSM